MFSDHNGMSVKINKKAEENPKHVKLNNIYKMNQRHPKKNKTMANDPMNINTKILNNKLANPNHKRIVHHDNMHPRGWFNIQ